MIFILHFSSHKMYTGGIVCSTLLGMGVLSGIVTCYIESKTNKRCRGGGELCIPVPEPETLLGLVITVPLLFTGVVGLVICSIFEI